MTGLVSAAGPASAAPPAPKGGAANTATISNAGLPAKFGSWGELFEAQRPLDEAATRIEAAVNANRQSGYTSLRVDVVANLITVYWKGEPTPVERASVEAARAAGIGVQLRPARYSRSELDAKVDRLLKDAKGSASEKLHSITKEPDGSGVQVRVATTLGPAPTARTLGASLPNVQAAVRDGGVTIVASTSPPRGTSREDDQPPYWGGALIDSVDAPDIYQPCSTGFAVYWPANSTRYMTTAGHCIRSHAWTWSGRDMGPVDTGNVGHDLSFIRTSSFGTIHTGPPVFMANQGHTPVQRAARTHTGDWLCMSPPLTGWSCSIQASPPTIDCAVTYLGQCVRVIGGISSVDQLIVGSGDSGAPVFAPINGIGQPNSAAEARGIVHGMPNDWPLFPCPDLALGGWRYCATAVWFTDLLDAIQPWANLGMHVMTS